MLQSDFDCVGGWCPSPLLFKGQLYLLSTHQRIIPDARSRALGQFPLVSTREDTRETELSTFRTSLPGPQTAGASARCLCWAPSPRPGPPASETARALDTQRGPSTRSPRRAHWPWGTPGGTLGSDECWHRGQDPCRVTQQKDPRPGAPPTSSLVRSTSLGSFTRIRFVTMRLS